MAGRTVVLPRGWEASCVLRGTLPNPPTPQGRGAGSRRGTSGDPCDVAIYRKGAHWGQAPANRALSSMFCPLSCNWGLTSSTATAGGRVV